MPRLELSRNAILRHWCLLMALCSGLKFAAAPYLAEWGWCQEPADARDEALRRATGSIEAAVPRALADPARPGFHFLARSQWMNDPNGPIQHRGYFHVFYQHNPYGDGWGNMHWGHARSRDLVRWEHLPLALWPSRELGEEHCFSGCCALNGQGQPMIFYTSIGPDRPAESDRAEQWAALGDADLIRWGKHPANPILSPALHGKLKVFDWRDPFLFRHADKTYLVLGGNLNERRGKEAVVLLYRALNGDLTEWEYRGVLFRHPDADVVNIECPNFFPLGNKWVLIVSPHRRVEYFVGDWDEESGQFSIQRRGLVDVSENFYAPNSFLDEQGRRILWGWVRGFPGGRGWNGCLGLPRVLSLDSEGRLLQAIAHEMELLRGAPSKLNARLDDATQQFESLAKNQLEIELHLRRESAAACGLKLWATEEGEDGLAISLDDHGLKVGSLAIPLAASRTSEARLRIFLDHSVVEVHDQVGEYSATVVFLSDPHPHRVLLFARDGAADFQIVHWPLAVPAPTP